MNNKFEIKDEELKKISGGTRNNFSPHGDCPNGLTEMVEDICKNCISIESCGKSGYFCRNGVRGNIELK